MSKIILSAQNIDIREGDELDPHARTGATSAEQVYHAGATGVILGHSEIGDTPTIVRDKLFTIVHKASARGGDFLKNITLLVGETWQEFQEQNANEIAKKVVTHLSLILNDAPAELLRHLVVGYEPKWGSRGSGRDDALPPSPDAISVVCRAMRNELTRLTGPKTGNAIPIIYGGRSTPERTEQILADENVEGLILGSACSSVEKTMAIAKVMARKRPNKRKILHANFKAYELADSYEDYVERLFGLDETFVIYLSPCHADLREVGALLMQY